MDDDESEVKGLCQIHEMVGLLFGPRRLNKQLLRG